MAKKEKEIEVKFVVTGAYLNCTVGTSKGKIDLSKATQAELKFLHELGHEGVSQIN